MEKDFEEFLVKASSSSSTNKKHSVFKSHKDDNIIWGEVRMKRDNDHQPWHIKHGSGKNSRRFKTIKEGGVNENASYFLFYKTNNKSNTYQVCPVDDWYSISATQRYKTLTAEEAEQKFEERHKTLNHFSVMYKKKNGENGDDIGHDRSFKVSEMEDWDNSGDDDDSDNDGEDGDESKKKLKNRRKKDKEEPEDAPEEGKEDSDEGDFEQREVDYMSDSSSESSDGEVEKDVTDVKGIAEEEALRDLLSTDDEEDVENPQHKNKSNDNKSTLGTVDTKADLDGSDGDASSDSEDYDVDEDKMDSIFEKKGLPTSQLNALVKTDEPDSVPSQSKSSTSTNAGSKRKVPPETAAPQPAPPIRKPRTVEPPPSSQAVSYEEKIVEELIRKYLSRKPMRTKDLLIQIKSKFKRISGVTPEMNEGIVDIVASVIRRMQLDNQKINDVIYLSLRQ